MLKGISERNNTWHLRNHIRNAKKKLSHPRRIALYSSGDNAERFKLAKADRQYKEAIEREKQVTLNWWQRIRLFISRLFNRYARA